jgi:transposase-like protein
VPRTRPPYPEEFRREAIRLARLGDKPQRQLAKDLGISDVTLRNWIKQEKAERGERPGGLSQDEREELNRLRDENAKLRRCDCWDAGTGGFHTPADQTDSGAPPPRENAGLLGKRASPRGGR